MNIGFLFFKHQHERLTKQGYFYIYSNKDKIYNFDGLEHDIIRAIINEISVNNNFILLTNLNTDEILKIKSQIKKIYDYDIQLKDRDFLGVSYQEIKQDLGLIQDNSQNVLKIAILFNNIIQFLKNKYNNFDDLLNSKNFISEVANLNFPPKKILYENEQESRLYQIYSLCYQPVVYCKYDEKQDLKDKIEIIIRRNRYVHCSEILSCVYPSGNVEHIDEQKLSEYKNPLLWILNSTNKENSSRYALLRVNISKITPKLKGILGFKSNNVTQFEIKNEWLTSIEAQFYANYANIEVKEVYLWDKKAKLNQNKNSIEVFIGEKDPLLNLSLTYQYLAQIYLKARNYVSIKENNGIAIGGYNVDIRTIWQMAYNKILMINMVELLYKRFNIQVLEYGMGYIRLYVNNDELSIVKELVKNSGWSFPLSTTPEDNHNYILNTTSKLLN